MAQSNYCSPLPDYIISENCVSEAAGIISAGFILDSANPFADYEDNAEWAAKIAANTVLVAYDARGEFPGSEVNSNDDAFGRAASEFQSFSGTVTYEHKGIHIGTSGARTNIVAYEALAKNGGRYFFFWVTSDLKLWISPAPVNVKPKQVVAKSKKEQQFWQVEVNWDATELPQTYDAPVDTYIQP